ncbi:right-handed parallel beta-helix repeat-containing protein [uncultured Amnibacterium sp.]|uniref:right-handed parallel beta-helix repeat-containing protein n=1 Tax=uncultured Amnibacterium sp. TaxID=1631851 RepID=UPI0035CBC98B
MRFLSHAPSPARAGLGVLLAAALAGGAILAAPLTASAAAATYYVDCSHGTNGDGVSAATAWNSLAAVNAHGAFAPGERILLKRGTTCKGQLAPTGSGTQGAPIVIGAFPASGTRPTIAGGGTYNYTGAVQIINQAWWTVQDLHITNTTKEANPKTYRSGLLLLNSNGGRLSGLTVQRVAVDGVRSNPGNGNTRQYGGISALTFGKGSSYDGLRILSSSVTNSSRTGIIVSNNAYPGSWDSAVLISGNRVKSVRGDGIVLIGAKSSRITGNVVTGAGDLGSCSHCGRLGGPSTASAGIWPSNTSKVRIDHNEVSKTRNTGGDGEGFDIDRASVDTVLEYNYAHDNQGGGVLLTGAKNSTIRFNILENNGQGALTFYGKAPSTNTAFYNNTVYVSRASKAKIVRTFGAIKGSKVSFKNNVIYSYGTGVYQWPTKSVTTSSNTLIGNHGSGRPRDAKTSYAAPGLKKPGTGGNGFKTLKGYKPAHPSSFKKGVAIPKSVKTDFFGKRISAKKPPRGAAG